MLLADGMFEGRRVVSTASVKAMFTPWNGGPTGPGMAWGIGRTQIGHAGNGVTFSARVALFPSEGYGIAILTNVNSGPFFAGSSALLDGTARYLRGGTVPPSLPRELLFKAALLVSVLWSVGRLASTGRRWVHRGRPLGLPRRRGPWARLGVEVLLSVAVISALPRWLGIPLRVLLEYFPDLGLAMVVGVAAGLSRAVLETFLAARGETGVAPR
jgi:hypothetical protein